MQQFRTRIGHAESGFVHTAIHDDGEMVGRIYEDHAAHLPEGRWFWAGGTGAGPGRTGSPNRPPTPPRARRCPASPHGPSFGRELPSMPTSGHSKLCAREAASRHLGSPRNDAFRPRPHFGRGQTSGDRLVPWGTGIWGDADRGAVIGRTENDRLFGTDCGQVQDRGRAREQEQRPREVRTPA